MSVAFYIVLELRAQNVNVKSNGQECPSYTSNFGIERSLGWKAEAC